MRAAVFHGPGDIRIDRVPDPRIEKPTDAIVRITHSAICGSDLWFYRGQQDYEAGWRVGHEPMGVVEAVGSEVRSVKPGDFVICDQLVDRTNDRPNTLYDGPETTHISFADPYCPTMRDVAIARGRELSIPLHDRGTVVVIEGPRFSTRAESAWFASAGWEVINMTQYPEAVLARELELCYANISLITDYDVGVEGVPPVTHEEVVRVFTENNEKLRDLLFAVIPDLPVERDCPCATALQGARFEVT